MAVDYKKKFDFAKIARNIIEKSLKIKDGELVWILCGRHNIEFAEELAASVFMRGAQPLIELSSPQMKRKLYLEAPEGFIQRPRTRIAKLKEQIDAFIWLDPEDDPEYLSDISLSRIRLAGKASEPEHKTLEHMQTRRLLIEYPTPKKAEFYGIDYDELYNMVWSAIEVDPDYLYENVLKIQNFIGNSGNITVKSDKGTNITFSAEGRIILNDTGEVTIESLLAGDTLLNIPAGEIFLAPVEESAEGIAVFDEVFFNHHRVKDLSLNFEKGKVVNFSAAEGEEYFKEYYEQLSENGKIISEFGIGLNPCINKVIGMLSTDEKVIGTIHIAIGANASFGGTNEAINHDDFVMLSPTVITGERILMEKGRFNQSIGFDVSHK